MAPPPLHQWCCITALWAEKTAVCVNTLTPPISVFGARPLVRVFTGSSARRLSRLSVPTRKSPTWVTNKHTFTETTSMFDCFGSFQTFPRSILTSHHRLQIKFKIHTAHRLVSSAWQNSFFSLMSYSQIVSVRLLFRRTTSICFLFSPLQQSFVSGRRLRFLWAAAD